MNNRRIEERIQTAVEHLTPDVLDRVLDQIDRQKDRVLLVQPVQKKRNWVRTISALAAAVVLLIGGVFAYSRVIAQRADTLVMLDVNPSIEIKLNKQNRVIEVVAKNEDAVKILDNMDLTNTPVDVTVNALVGSMLKQGYIRENANSLLLSVEGTDQTKSAELQKMLTQSVSQQLNIVNGAVISQALTGDQETQRLAEEYNISFGKASLVQKIIVENSHLSFGDLAKLSVNELNLLYSAKHIISDTIESHGSASATDYIGEQRAKEIALKQANLSENQVQMLQTGLDYEDGTMVYDVEFVYNNREYEYEINARNGSVLKSDQGDIDKEDREEMQNHQTQNSSAFIGEAKAKEIAENDAGTTSHIGLKVDLDKDDGFYVYEVEFHVGKKEYSYEINATTGAIISRDVE